MKKEIYDIIFTKSNIDKFIDRVNKDINIPIISEKTERKILENLVHHFKCVVFDSLNKK